MERKAWRLRFMRLDISLETPMRTLALAGFAALLSTAALAQTTVIHRDGPGAVVDHETTGTVEKKTVTRTDDSAGCGSKTVHKEDSDGNSKTVHKEGC